MHDIDIWISNVYIYILNIKRYLYIYIFIYFYVYLVCIACIMSCIYVMYFLCVYLFIKLLSHRVCKAKSGRIRRDTSMSIVCRVCPGYITELSEDDAQGLNAIIREAGLWGQKFDHRDGYFGWTTIICFKLHLCLDEICGSHFCRSILSTNWSCVFHSSFKCHAPGSRRSS